MVAGDPLPPQIQLDLARLRQQQAALAADTLGAPDIREALAGIADQSVAYLRAQMPPYPVEPWHTAEDRRRWWRTWHWAADQLTAQLATRLRREVLGVDRPGP